jgi:Fe-S cluster assembly protein SufD
VQTYVEEFERFASNGASALPAWSRAARREAIGRFSALGFPTPKNEDWHFTSVAPIADAKFRTAHVAAGGVRASDLEPFLFGHAEWPTLVFVNGQVSTTLSHVGPLVRPGSGNGGGVPGVRILPLSRAWHDDPDFLERHLGSVTEFGEHAFTALNTAFMYDGAVVHVPAGVAVNVPIHVVYVADARAERHVIQPRSLIVADANARVTVIESYVSLGDAPYFTNAVTEVRVGDGASVSHVKIQRESPAAFHVGTIESRQGKDSHFVSFSFASGGALSRTNIYTLLDGPGCGATLYGLYLVDGDQHTDHQTRIEHAQPNCFSREVYKGILDGAGHGVFNGKVFVRPIAQKTDGKQENNNLLLSDRARVDTKPQLEIFADDVKCTHGATVGRIDDMALFYMKSRGIDALTARDLLTYAFAADVLERIEIEPVRVALEALTLRRFTGRE